MVRNKQSKKDNSDKKDTVFGAWPLALNDFMCITLFINDL